MANSTKKTTSSNDAANLKKNRQSGFWKFTPQAESLNGRLAMIGFVSVLLVELFSGQGLLHFWNVF